MESDARFVKYVKHVDQLGAYLRSQTYALLLTARQRLGGTVEREVIQTHLKHELESGTYLLEYLVGDGTLALAQTRLHVTGPVIEVLNIHRCQLVYVLAVNAEVECLFVESRSAALGAHAGHSELVGPFLLGGAQVSLLLQRAYVLDHALILHEHGIGLTVYAGYLHLDAVITAVEQLIDHVIGHIGYRGIESIVVFIEQSGYLPEYKCVLERSQRSDGTLAHGERAVRQHLVLIDGRYISQALALGAESLRGVEREVMRRGVAVRDAGLGAHEALAVMTQHAGLGASGYGLLWHGEYHHDALTLLHGQRHALGQTVTVFLIDHKFLNHHLDVMVAVTVQLHAGFDLTQLAVHAHVYVTLAAYALKQLLVMALAVAHQRSQHVDSLSLIVRYDALHYLLLGELDHLLAR